MARGAPRATSKMKLSDARRLARTTQQRSFVRSRPQNLFGEQKEQTEPSAHLCSLVVSLHKHKTENRLHFHYTTMSIPSFAVAVTALLLVVLLQGSLAFAPPATTVRSSSLSQLHAFIPRRNNNANVNNKQSRLASSSTSSSSSSSSSTINGSPSTASRSSNNRKAACFPTDTPWEIHKFGGASLANAELYRTVGDLLLREQSRKTNDNNQKKIPTMAVVSARGGMTDLLVKVVDSALVNFQDAERALAEAVATQIEVLKELAPLEITQPIEASMQSDAKDILSVVQSLRMLNTVPAVTMEVVTGFGEIW